MQGLPCGKATTDFQEQLTGFQNGSVFPYVLLPVTTQWMTMQVPSLLFQRGAEGRERNMGSLGCLLRAPEPQRGVRRPEANPPPSGAGEEARAAHRVKPVTPRWL